jgi:predicted homoserine dehydrogenase-like protein
MVVDAALHEREATGRPIRVGIVGAGATGRAIALQLGTPVPGIRLAAIANRTPEHGARAFREANIASWSCAESAREAETAIARGLPVLTDDPSVLTTCDAIDVLVEVTGTVEAAACVALEAFDNGKHVVLVNAELDSLVGPILKTKADRAGVVVTHTDGDEPGVAMTLFRYLKSLGLRPVAAGNIKGMVDHYRNPETQKAFAEKNDQDVRKVTSFADATKLSMEATVLANATGFRAGRRGNWPRRLCPRRRPSHWRLCHRSRGFATQKGSACLLQTWRRSILCLLHAISSAPHPDRFDDRSGGHSS